MSRIEGSRPAESVPPAAPKNVKGKKVSSDAIQALPKSAASPEKAQALSGMVHDVLQSRPHTQIVDGLIQYCSKFDGKGAALYEELHPGLQSMPDQAVSQMLQFAGKGGSVADYKSCLAEGDFEGVAKILPTPIQLAMLLEKLKNPDVFAAFETFINREGVK